MAEGFLLSRVLLHFDSKFDGLCADLSAATATPEGNLWIASDETTTIERLSSTKQYTFGDHQQFAIADFIDLFNQEDEVDIEGMDYAGGYLWLIGSHSTKRKKPKGKNVEKDLHKLARTEAEPNRYLLARIPVFEGELFKSCAPSDRPENPLTAAILQKVGERNSLMEALEQDTHLGEFVAASLPAKENGFDIEGLTVCGDTILIGLRGPVLGGWAIILEVEVTEVEAGVLQLKEIGKQGLRYKKHFVDLGGLGIRELCLRGDDLLVLAGPTMDLDGSTRVFRLKKMLKHSDESRFWQDSEDLELLFDIPFGQGTDHAEGLVLFSFLEKTDSLLVIYDSPDAKRMYGSNSVLADVYRLT